MTGQRLRLKDEGGRMKDELACWFG